MVVDGIGVLVSSLFALASEENCQLTSVFADFQGFSELLPDLVASPSSASPASPSASPASPSAFPASPSASPVSPTVPVFLFDSFRSDRACSRDRFLTHCDVAADDTFLPLVAYDTVLHLVAYDTFRLLRCTNPVACVSLVFSFV